MSDRFYALTVVLDKDTRDDDAEPLIAAIRQLRQVVDVKAHVSNVQSYTAYARARFDVEARLLAALRKEDV